MSKKMKINFSIVGKLGKFEEVGLMVGGKYYIGKYSSCYNWRQEDDFGAIRRGMIYDDKKEYTELDFSRIELLQHGGVLEIESISKEDLDNVIHFLIFERQKYFRKNKQYDYIIEYLLLNRVDREYNLDKHFVSAAAIDNFGLVKLLHKLGADVHADNDSALCWASTSGHVDIVRFLLDRGVKADARDNHAIRYATHNSFIDTVRLLISRGASIDVGMSHILRGSIARQAKEVESFYDSFA